VFQGPPGVDELDHHLGLVLAQAPCLSAQLAVQVDAGVRDIHTPILRSMFGHGAAVIGCRRGGRQALTTASEREGSAHAESASHVLEASRKPDVMSDAEVVRC
jgi:hypothetical protein